MFRLRRTTHEPRIELAPLIDVMLFLLTFFIYSVMVTERVDLVLIPKAESADDVRAVDEHLRAILGAEHGVWLMPIIESARGALQALDVATACPAVVALAIGLEDYTADIGAQRTRPFD